jgi:hypothetical protein
MSAAVNHYECEVDGWRWVYEIDDSKLIANGKNGVEFQHFEFELKHCSDVTDRGAKAQIVQFPLRAWLVWGGIVALTVVLLVAGIVVLSVFNIQMSVRFRTVLTIVLIGFVILEMVSLPFFVSKFLHKRKVQRYVTFKRLSDGAAQFTLHSAFNEDDHTFDDFVGELLTTIQRQRTTQTPPDYSFKQ